MWRAVYGISGPHGCISTSLAGIPPEKVLQKNAGLRAALLVGNGHAPGYELLRTVRLRLATGRDIVLARLYRVHH